MIQEALNNVNESISNTVQEISGIIKNQLRKQQRLDGSTNAGGSKKPTTASLSNNYISPNRRMMRGKTKSGSSNELRV